MYDTREIDEQAIDLHIADRDRATREATNQLVAAVLDLRAAVGRTPYVTTQLNTAADVQNVLGTLADITDKLGRWFDANAHTVAEATPPADTARLVRDLRRDLKGLTANLHNQHRCTRESISRAWTLISHRPGVVGREVL